LGGVGGAGGDGGWGGGAEGLGGIFIIFGGVMALMQSSKLILFGSGDVVMSVHSFEEVA
jgi:hypothetical protein